MNKVLNYILILMLSPMISLLAQEPTHSSETTQSSIDSSKPEYGIIFNIGSILDGISSYQGGIGVKYHKDDIYWRFLIDINYDYESNFFSTLLGVNREYHIVKSKLSPYYGWTLSTGVTHLYTEGTDTTLITIPINTGAIFGIEWSVTDYISLSVEYTIALEYTYNSQTSPLYSDEQNSNFTLNTGLGNYGKIGVTVYFPTEIQQSETQ
ncbi:hypothetical protein [Marispirochaeta aestuarii]|uniref:hypothetical protein n=1 Tax=Marispirochaeta aestuarii TaxID=1963862 RepID=UPI0029C962A0|nr:hypothetical protein [Marispirochaeta aestuarii]